MALNETLTKVSAVVVAFLCIVVFSLCFAALFVPWTDYKVSNGLLDKVEGSPELKTLYFQWPQMFYPRGVYLQQTCFPGINETVWSDVFKRTPKLCGKSGNKCYCMTNEEYQKPTNTSTYKQSHNQQILLSLYNACLGLTSLVVALTTLLFFAPFFLKWSPKVIGISAFITVVMEELAIVAVIIMYCSAEDLETTTVEPPHHGFIKQNPDILAATQVSRTHGFPLCCSIVAIVTVKVIFYLCSWCPYLCDTTTNSEPDGLVTCCKQRCCCCTPELPDGSDTATQLSSTRPNYGAAETESSKDKLSPK